MASVDPFPKGRVPRQELLHRKVRGQLDHVLKGQLGQPVAVVAHQRSIPVENAKDLVGIGADEIGGVLLLGQIDNLLIVPPFGFQRKIVEVASIRDYIASSIICPI